MGATWRTHYRQLQTSNLDAFWTERSRTPEELEADLQAGRYFEDGLIADFLAPNANSKGASSLRPVFNRLLDTTRSDVSDLAKQHTQLIDDMPQCERQEHPLHYNFPFILNGPNAHLQRLEELSNRGSADELCAEFGSLRDAISLFPRNNGIKPFLGALLQSTHAAATERLRADCDGKRVMLHTSCQHRLAETEKTVASFDRGGTGLHHVILLGDVTSRTEDETPLSFDYDGRVLSVPVPDTYEHLHRKMFYSYMLLDVLTQPALLVKVDDNVLMQDFDRFVACLDKVEANSAGYAGRRVGADRHDAQWHGWHIGKCADPQIQTRGFQYPLPRDYAAGGYGYVLGPQGLAACSYMYLAMKAFFAMRVVGLEDAYVGLAAYAQGLELMDISDAQTLLVLPGLTTKERQRHIDGVTAN